MANHIHLFGGSVVLFFSQRYLDDLRARCDIVEIVSQSVSLQKKGKRYWACCPFHGEKTPSFSVNPEMQMYYCFGCHASGNVIGFIMAMEKLDFVDAVKYLAERANMPLPEVEDEQAYRRERAGKERLYAANTAAAHFFFEQLFTPAGKDAIAYLLQRGIDERGIRRFGLGFAPGGEVLCRHLRQKGFSDEEMELAGLSRKGQRGVYDQFRNRVMYPIIDGLGRVVGFGGRVMGNGQPKYLNTSDTPVFNKRHQLYGINLLKKQRDLSRVIVVEGYMDVIALDLAGIRGAVASLGTALTSEQARLIKRYCEDVLIAYDGDTAGQTAMLRGLDILHEEGLKVRVVVMPEGKDPDDLARQGGSAAFDALAEKALPLPVFKMKRAALAEDMSTQQGRTAYAMAASEILAQVENPVERESYLKILQVETGFSLSTLEQQVQVADGVLSAQEARRHNYAMQRYNNGGKSTQPEGDRRVFLAEGNILAAVAGAGRDAPALLSIVDVSFTVPAYAQALKKMREIVAQGETLSPAGVAMHFSGDSQEEQMVCRLLAQELTLPDPMEFVRQNVQTLWQAEVSARILMLKQEMGKPGIDPAERARLAAEIQSLMASAKGPRRPMSGRLE